MTGSLHASDRPARSALGPTAMIVEDEPDQLGLLTTMLRRAGCTVIAVAAAEPALSFPLDLQLDLIVLDLRLPGIDGWELSDRLRERYPGCPIVITSVLDVDEYPVAEGVLPKPITRAQVQRIVDELVRGEQTR